MCLSVFDWLSLSNRYIAPKQEEIASSETESETESDSEAEEMETDAKRREWMRKSMKDDHGLKKSSQQFMRDFLSGASTSQPSGDSNFDKLFEAIEISDDEDEPACDIPSAFNPVNPARPGESSTNDRPSKRQKTSSSESKTSGPSLRLGRIVQEEIASRKREALGLVGERKLGSGVRPVSKLKGSTSTPIKTPTPANTTPAPQDPGWSCQVCTL